MKIDTEIKLLDLIKLIILIIGGVFSFVLLHKVASENDTLRTKKLFLDEFHELYPNLKIHYTNMYDSTKENLELRVYIENKSKFPIHISNHGIELYDENQNFTSAINNSSQLGGTISPEAKFNVKYSIKADTFRDRYISTSYTAKIDTNVKKTYNYFFHKTLDFNNYNNAIFDSITIKKFSYYEKIYDFKRNDIWDDFFENPR